MPTPSVEHLVALHREHCACMGVFIGDGCDLVAADLTEQELDRAHHDSFVWPPAGAVR